MLDFSGILAGIRIHVCLLALQNDPPSSLAAYLESCRSLSLDRTCSDDSILSFPPREGEPEKPKPWVQGIKMEREKTAEEKAAKINIKNALKAGKSPKKEHEVDRFSTLGTPRPYHGAVYCN